MAEYKMANLEVPISKKWWIPQLIKWGKKKGFSFQENSLYIETPLAEVPWNILARLQYLQFFRGSITPQSHRKQDAIFKWT